MTIDLGTISSFSMIGTVLGTYEDSRFKSESKKPTLKSVDIIGLGVGSDIEKKLKQAEFISSAVIFGKNLVNAPANVLTPGSYSSLFLFLFFFFFFPFVSI